MRGLRQRVRCAGLSLLLLLPVLAWSQAGTDADNDAQRAEKAVNALEAPLYSPFVERYVLDELRQVRTDMQELRAELIKEVVDRELAVADKSMRYATDTVTYFFYLIAGATSVLVLAGWNSIRDIKEKAHSLANAEVSKLVERYESRLRAIEQQLQQKTQHIDENREQIEQVKEISSLWLRSSQEHSAANKIPIYDQILKLNPGDTEAISYKADAALELGEPLWAINLCRQALALDPENGHAFYQLACAYAATGYPDESVENLRKAITLGETYRQDALEDPAFEALRDTPDMQSLLIMPDQDH